MTTGFKFGASDGDGKSLRTLRAEVDNTVGATTIGRIPKGAKVYRVTVGIITGFNGTGATLDIGISTDTDKYMDNTDMTEATPGTYVKVPQVTAATADETIIATLGGTTGAAGNATVLVDFSDHT